MKCTSYKCSCGATVKEVREPGDEDDQGLVVELDGVVHDCDSDPDAEN